MKQIQLTYHEESGYLYPDLTLPEQTHHPIGKYGDLYLAFIKAHRKWTYTTLLTTGRLNEHLYMVDAEAKETVRRLTAEFAKARGIDEKLKAEYGAVFLTPKPGRFDSNGGVILQCQRQGSWTRIANWV